MLNLLLVLAALALIVGIARMKRGDDTTDFEVLRIDFTPPVGSEVVAGTPITCEVHYRYSKPRKAMRAWAQLRDNPNSTYEPSELDLRPGTGSFRRFVQVNEADVVEVVHIVGRDEASRVNFHHRVPAQFQIVPDPELERLRDDGIGARVTGLRLDPPNGSTLAVGKSINVHIDFAVRSERGVNVWAHALSNGEAATYGPSENLANGVGTVTRWVSLGKPGELQELVIVMANVAGTNVCVERVGISFHFT